MHAHMTTDYLGSTEVPNFYFVIYMYVKAGHVVQVVQNGNFHVNGMVKLSDLVSRLDYVAFIGSLGT